MTFFLNIKNKEITVYHFGRKSWTLHHKCNPILLYIIGLKIKRNFFWSLIQANCIKILIKDTRRKPQNLTTLDYIKSRPATLIWHKIWTNLRKNLNIQKVIWMTTKIEFLYRNLYQNQSQKNLNLESGYLNFT